jgi:ankyrin repeat protein
MGLTPVAQLLIDLGANVDIPNNNNVTPLMMAVCRCNSTGFIDKITDEESSLLKDIVGRVRNINAQDSNGDTALWYAAI